MGHVSETGVNQYPLYISYPNQRVFIDRLLVCYFTTRNVAQSGSKHHLLERHGVHTLIIQGANRVGRYPEHALSNISGILWHLDK